MYVQKFELTGRKAVVTGGAQGIGLAIATALVESGAQVVIADRSTQTGAAAARDLAGSSFVEMNVTDSVGVRRVADELVARLGGIDILVNNAGIARNSAAIDTPEAEWRDVIDVNLNGVWWCSQAFGRHMVARKRGAIVNLGSMSGLIANRPQGQAHYNASKAAVHMLTKSLAVEWAEFGVRVNAVAPGYIGTEMTKLGMANEEWRRVWLDMTPVRRVGQPWEIAAAVLFLASDAASFMTGSIVSVDGGYTSW